MKILIIVGCLAVSSSAFAQTPDAKEVPLTLQEFNDLWSLLENAPVPHKIIGPMEDVMQKAAIRAVAAKQPAPPVTPPAATQPSPDKPQP